jgi:hypothetical protein
MLIGHMVIGKTETVGLEGKATAAEGAINARTASHEATRLFATRSSLAAKVVFAERFQAFGRIVCLFDNDQGDNRLLQISVRTSIEFLEFPCEKLRKWKMPKPCLAPLH